MAYSFYAFISRLKNITRWSLMRNSQTENVQEHSHMVAVIAHSLALIRRDVFGKEADPNAAAAAALFHDAPEIFTGDMPTPVKYHNSNIISAYKEVERLAGEKLVSTLPEEMRAEYSRLLDEENNPQHELIKAADKLAAYIKCLEEQKAGNLEFKSAAEETAAKLRRMNMPEVDYFMENFIPAFSLTLDELSI